MKRCTNSVAALLAKSLLFPLYRRLPVTDDTNARRPLSFHAVLFGEESSSSSLRRMAEIALEVQNDGTNDPRRPTGANVPSAYTEALDTVRRP